MKTEQEIRNHLATLQHSFDQALASYNKDNNSSDESMLRRLQIKMDMLRWVLDTAGQTGAALHASARPQEDAA